MLLPDTMWNESNHSYPFRRRHRRVGFASAPGLVNTRRLLVTNQGRRTRKPANGARIIARFSVISLAPDGCPECDQIEQDGASKELTAGPLPRTIATDGWIRNSRKGRACLLRAPACPRARLIRNVRRERAT